MQDNIQYISKMKFNLLSRLIWLPTNIGRTKFTSSTRTLNGRAGCFLCSGRARDRDEVDVSWRFERAVSPYRAEHQLACLDIVESLFLDSTLNSILLYQVKFAITWLLHDLLFELNICIHWTVFPRFCCCLFADNQQVIFNCEFRSGLSFE